MKLSLLFLFFILTTDSFSQALFDRELNIPVTEGSNTLRFPWAGGINFPWISSINLNDDTLADLFLYDHHNNRTLTFLNNGSPSINDAWDYAPEYAHQFPPINSWAFLYDYNCDGKADFFTLSSAFQCSGIMVYKNISSGANLQWSLVDSCLKRTFASTTDIIYANSISLPNFNDVDGDGDMDIIGYNNSALGRFSYYKNNSIENFGICDSLDFELQTLCWGNFQLKIGGTNSVGCFHCPCRIRRPDETDSSFQSHFKKEIDLNSTSTDQSEAARRDDTVSSVYSIDLDGDGNKELLIGDIASTNTLMVHNSGTDMDSQDTLFPSYDSPAFFNGFHYHSYIDVDNDGLKDLIAMPYYHENKIGLWVYKNNGTNSSPVFNLESVSFLQDNMIDVGEDACPVFFDYDRDSLEDMVISKAVFDSVNGNYKAGLYLYKNSGTTTLPSFELVTDNFAGLSSTNLYVSPTYPSFGDLDGDGDKDMVLGLEDGHLQYFENTASAGNPASFNNPVSNYMAIDIGKYATPQLYDLDRDGILDIICGSQRGFVNYFRNTGSNAVPIFSNIATNDTLGCIVLQGNNTTDGFTVPFLYDSLGSTRLLVASEDGNINQYDNIDGNLNGCFHLSGKIYDTPESSRIKFNITVSGADLNGDSLTDIVIGQSTGGAEIRYQHNPHIGIREESLIKPTFEVFPNPVNNEMNIRFYHLGKNSSFIRIYNSIGELIKVEIINGVNTELKTSSWSNGIYFVQLISGRYSLCKKIIINH